VIVIVALSPRRRGRRGGIDGGGEFGGLVAADDGR
jgi:hypothetical protein